MREANIDIDRNAVQAFVEDIESSYVFQEIVVNFVGPRNNVGFVRSTSGLSRDLNCFDIVKSILSAIVGTGITMQILHIQTSIPSIMNLVPLSLLIAIIPAFMIALAFSSLASAIPRAGGEYVFITRSLDPFFGFWASWGKWIGISFAVGGIIHVTAGLFGELLSPFEIRSTAIPFLQTLKGNLLFSMFVLLVALFISSWGNRIYRWILSLSFLNLIIVGGIIVACSFFYHGQYLRAASLYWGQETIDKILLSSKLSDGASVVHNRSEIFILLSGAGLLFFSFTGFETSTALAGEIQNARRNLPRAITWAMIFVGFYYILVSASVYSIVPWPLIKELVRVYPLLNISHLIGILLPRYLQIILMIGILIILFSEILPWLLAGSRIVFAWSFDGVLPEFFSQLSRNNSPYAALILTYFFSLVSIVLLNCVDKTLIISFFSLTTLWAYIFITLALLLLPLKRPLFYRMSEYKLEPLNTLVSIIGLFSSLVLFGFVLLLSIKAFMLFVVWQTVGAAYYFAIYSKRSQEGIDLDRTLSLIPPE